MQQNYSSLLWASLLQIFQGEQYVLPIYNSNNSIKCLDFNIDTVVFPTGIKKIIEVNPSNNSTLDVMDMV